MVQPQNSRTKSRQRKMARNQRIQTRLILNIVTVLTAKILIRIFRKNRIRYFDMSELIDKEIDMSDLNLSGLRRITDNFLFVYIENKNT